ncbi:MAG: RsmB/NOP family class I SAM-dependent RNA methyltransferase [Alphaproteobacteria bacterium]|nr:RsmB/NOP family class I SAM-dependent RNA methyltransferase [Alphaproteobacteria bacterium]
MKSTGRIGAVVEILTELFKFEDPADNTLNLYFRNHRYIGSKDRRYIADVVWFILRHYGRYQSLKNPLTPRVAVSLYLQENNEDPSIYFTGEHYAPEPLLDDEIVNFKGIDEVAECPDWLKNKIDTDDLIAMTKPALTNVRINPLKTTRDEVLEKLGCGEKTIYSPMGIELKQRVQLDQTDLFRDGLIEVQDEGSQLVALLTGAKPGEKVIDWCAGAGGKTLVLSALMKNSGMVYAIDMNKKRLKDLPDRAMRAGSQNIILLNDYKGIKAEYDLVVVDAPCTGIGTWRRSPDARWRITEKQSKEIIKVQTEILEKSCRAVKKNGRLFYITCSLDKDENDNQIQAFLNNHTDFELVDLSNRFNQIVGKNCTTEKMIHIHPAVYGTDGFFAAELRRR